jgi:hypothetical protein
MSLIVKYHLSAHSQESIIKSALSKEDDKQLLYQSLFKNVNRENKRFTHNQLDKMLNHLKEKGDVTVNHVCKEEFEIYGKYGRNDLITLI